jgi:glutathione S-transferase
MAKLVLYDWAPSPFCIKVRAVLARKGVRYERVNALSKVREVKRRGGIGKAPALELDGVLHVDSTDIAHELEARFPEPPVLPQSPRERARCHALEDWADEALYFLGLWHHWHEPSGRAQAKRYFAKSMLGRVLFLPYVARIEGQLKGQGTGRKSDAHVRADLERDLDAIEAMLDGRDWLLESGPWLCDYAVASQLTYLLRAPATRDALATRPATQAFLARMPEVAV